MIVEIVQVVQFVILLAIAPLITGVIRKVKALLQSRKGPSVLQPYRDLRKLFHKSSVVPEDASWVFTLTPYVCMAAAAAAALLVPVIIASTFGFFGDLIVLIYLLATVRFFTALAALDAGSAFGGMGASREMMISSIVEPTMLLSIFSVALVAGTTSLGTISQRISTTGMDLMEPALLLAGAAFFIALLAENARVPFDNPATHLELTMVHEAMVLEYSGKQLALMESASMLKLVVFMAILANIFFPWGIATSADPLSLALGTLWFLVKVIALALVIALIESSIAKMRLFRLPNLLTVAFTLALLAVVSFYILGAP
ncbi:respiratory chain complex I subunit 1 family protein [Methanomassiliicoccus luminyensis]|jgi:formate hydrogenlyase subunit 4|uniref:respiratory chain complex I subunit 1 family protein n=1 Tax=Methanomassiliicoccus luminyensis TaxID=1080712 RepID=UPI000364D4CB|nr:NADH-quinone oxidoreductase subunit H [Methanomassiliicoccus luminyensis]